MTERNSPFLISDGIAACFGVLFFSICSPEISALKPQRGHSLLTGFVAAFITASWLVNG
jgi:hypothetical protein